MAPIVSIIMPVYNTEKYLERAIQSIIDQTIENWELILVDDGSTDHSVEICDQYAQKDPRISVIHIANSGAGEARNIGLTKACGENVFFCDSDDWMEKNYLQMLVSEMHPDIDMVYSNFSIENSEGKIEYISEFDIEEYTLSDCNSHRSFLVSYFKNCIGHTLWSRLFKKSIIEENHICFVNTNIAEDMTFLIMYLSYCSNKIQGIINSGYHYVLREGSLTKKIDRTDYLLEYISYSRIMYDCLKGNERILPFYPLVFYYFVQPELQKVAKRYGLRKVRETFVYNDGYKMTEKKFFVSLYADTEKYEKFLEKKEYQEIRNICEYFLKGNMTKLRLKNRLLYLLK